MPFLELTNKRIFYTDYQPPNSSARGTIVLTHGLGSSQNYYGAVIPALVDAGFRCIAYDTTGAGRSPPPEAEQSIELLAGDVIGIMDALGVDKAIIAGHSMGAVVAANAAATEPNRFAASLWIGPVSPDSSTGEFFSQRIRAVEQGGMEAVANSIPTAATAKTASPLVRAFIRELLLGQNIKGYIENCRVLVNAAAPAYASVHAPVLILAGAEDKSAAPDGCRKMLNEVAAEKKSLVVMEDVGHWLCIEAPEEVAKLILRFLDQISL